MNQADQKAQAIADQYSREDAKNGIELQELLPFCRVKGLTSCERMILAVELLPWSGGMKLKDKVLLAEVDTSTWWRAMHRSRVQIALVEKNRELYAHKTSPLAQKYLDMALGGDREALKDILQQIKVLDKPQPAHAPKQIVTVVVQQERENKLGRGMRRLGWGSKAAVKDD